MRAAGIYKITSKIKPNRTYISSSQDIAYRWDVHLNQLRRGKHHSVKLQRHYDKYGKNDLIFSIVVNCDIEDLFIIEQSYLDKLNPYFNILKVAGSSRGHTWKVEDTSNMKKANNSGRFKKGQKPHNCRKVLDTETEEVFGDIGLAADSINMKRHTLECKLNGQNPNNTKFKYFESR